MHSRAVLLVSLFAVACLIIVGSIALHLSTASAAVEDGVTNRNAVTARSTQNATSLDAAGPSSSRDSSAGDATVAVAAESTLSLAERSAVDSLRALLYLVHSNFDVEGTTVNNSMIPHLAQMITMINQHDRLAYIIEIVEPDPSLAQDRAQTLNNVLRLNVMEPSKLRIEGRQGMRAAVLEAFPV